MHEWSLACQLVREAEAEAERRNAVKVFGVTVSIGQLTGVVPELLTRAYDMARMGTLLEDAALEVEIASVKGRCSECGRESSIQGFGLMCPECGALGLEVLSGDDILLTKMDLEVSEKPFRGRGGVHV
jgi:hydrogenase nickel incorporation protein HypA/HybF